MDAAPLNWRSLVDRRGLLVESAILGACLAWACWPVLGEMARRWSNDPRYGHGYLVPLFAAALLWMRRSKLIASRPRPAWWGLALILGGAALHLAGGYLLTGWFVGLALLPYLAGACVLLGGRAALRWALPSILFLAFMVPLPWRLETSLGHSLQRIATIASTYGLQTLGHVAYAEGNVIVMDEARIGVVEACSGLGMLMTFVAISTAVAIVVQRPLPDKLLIVVSAVPIALVANVARIVLTGVMHKAVSSEWADRFYHDLAGWLMIPFALAMLWVELALLSRLFIEPPTDDPRALLGVGMPGGGRGASPAVGVRPRGRRG